MKTMVKLFQNAQEHLKGPRIVYPFNNDKIVFKLAKNPKNPTNYIYIFFKDEYIGKILKDGTFYPASHDAFLVDAVKAILSDPVEYLKMYGQKFSFCCFCGTEITSQNSLAVGYGPICAEKYGLPWEGMGEAKKQEDLTKDL